GGGVGGGGDGVLVGLGSPADSAVSGSAGTRAARVHVAPGHGRTPDKSGGLRRPAETAAARGDGFSARDLVRADSENRRRQEQVVPAGSRADRPRGGTVRRLHPEG